MFFHIFGFFVCTLIRGSRCEWVGDFSNYFFLFATSFDSCSCYKFYYCICFIHTGNSGALNEHRALNRSSTVYIYLCFKLNTPVFYLTLILSIIATQQVRFTISFNRKTFLMQKFISNHRMMALLLTRRVTEKGTGIQHLSAGQLNAPADFKIDFGSHVADSL